LRRRLNRLGHAGLKSALLRNASALGPWLSELLTLILGKRFGR
jgi:hypothetical protein